MVKNLSLFQAIKWIVFLTIFLPYLWLFIISWKINIFLTNQSLNFIIYCLSVYFYHFSFSFSYLKYLQCDSQ